MLELLSLIKDSSTPALLIGGGLIFLVLAIVGTIRGQIDVAPARQLLAGALGLLLLLAGVAIQLAPALRAPQPGLTHTAAPPAAPSATEQPAAPPTAAPAPAEVARTAELAPKLPPPTTAPAPAEREAPEASLRAYWQAVSERRYADAWPLLSANFRWTTHANDFEAYVRGYDEQGLCGVAPEQVAVVAGAAEYAQIEATMIYHKGADCVASPLALRFHMAPAADLPRWLIDRVELR